MLTVLKKRLISVLESRGYTVGSAKVLRQRVTDGVITKLIDLPRFFGHVAASVIDFFCADRSLRRKGTRSYSGVRPAASLEGDPRRTTAGRVRTA